MSAVFRESRLERERLMSASLSGRFVDCPLFSLRVSLLDSRVPHGLRRSRARPARPHRAHQRVRRARELLAHRRHLQGVITAWGLGRVRSFSLP